MRRFLAVTLLALVARTAHVGQAFELPDVKVHGAEGALVFEKSASPLELVRAIETLLRSVIYVAVARSKRCGSKT